jgi:hypothetical protein
MRCLLGLLFLATVFAGQAAATTTAYVTVNRNTPGAVVSNQILGMNLGNWFDMTHAGIASTLAAGGITAVRWPGGSQSDLFHWQSNKDCAGGYVNVRSPFSTFISDVAVPGRFDVAVTLNYGSNATCNGGGSPTEAAAWVAYAKAHGEAVSHWTVGNEVFGSWEYDLHPIKHDPTTYANAVATGYYPDIKAADPKALVGVVAAPGYHWDSIVLAKAKYDFVEFHYYAQTPGKESDSYLVGGKGAQDFANALNNVKIDLAAAGRSGTPIYVGELGSVYASPGKQSTSITQALFAGEALGEMMNAGVARATWWLGYGSCTNSYHANFSASLYGWQNFGGYQVVADGTPEYGCPSATKVPFGTPLPTARAYQLFSLVAKTGQRALPVTLSGATTYLRAYAATAGTGTALVLFNTNQTLPQNVSIAIAGIASSSKVDTTVYDRAIYDESRSNIWAAPQVTALGAKIMPLALTLQPWSMTVVQLK